MPAACPNCGRGINRTDQFCDSCGAFLGWEAGASAESQLLPQRGPRSDDQRAAVQLQLKSDLINVAPGSAESTSFTVKNLGTQVEEFRFAVAGPEWIVASPPVLSVYPGQEATGAIQAAPPRKPGSLAGIAPFRLTATSALHFQVSSSVAGRVDVAPYYELGAELAPTSSGGRGLTRHRVTLDNRGNVPLRIMLYPADVADGLRLGVPGFADVPPGRVTDVPVTVYGSRRWLGRPEPKTFSIIAEAPKPLEATRLSGTRTVLAVFPSWVPLAAAGLVVAAAGATAAAQLLGKHGPAGPSPSGTATAPPATPASSPPGTPASSAPATPASSPPATPASSAPASPASSPPTSPNSPPPVVAFDLTSAAASTSAKWTSASSAGQSATLAQTGTGCQTGANDPDQGAVFNLQQVVLEDGTQAPNALETDPPSRTPAQISGVYTLATPTAANETFRAQVGFCRTVPAGAQVAASVSILVGSTQQVLWTGTLTVTSPLTSIDMHVPADTTGITLNVANVTGPPYGDVVWVDPRIEASTAASPAPRPTVTTSL